MPPTIAVAAKAEQARTTSERQRDDPSNPPNDRSDKTVKSARWASR
jgi:hypothetical protein